MSESIDASIKDCEVCFHAFDGRDRRPRCIPCGHTLCTQCISDNLQENSLLCPFCRAQYQAKEPTDFPVVYALEKLIQKVVGGFPVTSNPPEPSVDPSKVLSRKLKSQIKALITDMETMRVKSQEVRSQLEHYQSLVNDWEEYNEKACEKFSAIANEHRTMAKSAHKESVRVSDVMKEGEEERQRMKMVEAKLLASTTTQDTLTTFEEAAQSYDALETWTQEAHKHFPNDQLIKRSLQLQERAEAALQTLPAYEGIDSAVVDGEESLTHDLAAAFSPELDTAGDSSRGTSQALLTTLREKLEKALEYAAVPKQTSNTLKYSQEKANQTDFQKDCQEKANQTDFQKDSQEVASQTDPQALQVEHRSNVAQINMEPSITVKSLRNMTLVHQRIVSGKVFAVQNLRGQQHYAKISFKRNKLCLHVLSQQTPPQDALILQYEEVKTLMEPSSKNVFLEFGTETNSLGIVFISLDGTPKRSQNFALLCSGEKGVSYRNTNIIQKIKSKYLGDRVRCGDYQYNYGRGGMELVPGTGKEMSETCQWLKGRVCGFSLEAEKASQFEIITRTEPFTPNCCYIGKVTSGLKIIRKAIRNYPDINEVKIIDCGLVL